MLARTDNPQRGEQGSPPGEDEDRDYENSEPRQKLHLEGSEDAGRALTVEFAAFVNTLKSIDDPDPAAKSYYEPGLALLGALIEENEDFATAAPGVAADAPLAEQVLALTDEAFEKAHTVLEALSGELGPAHADAVPPSQLQVLMYRLGTISITDETRRLLRMAPAPDPSMGGEFY